MRTLSKYLFSLCCFFKIISCFTANAQVNSGKTITPYQTIYSDSRGSVQMRFLLFSCSSDASRYYGFYSTISDKGGYVGGKFDFVECDGKTGTEKFYVGLSQTGEIKDGGDWFGSKPYKIIRVYDVRSWGGSLGNGSSPTSGSTGNGSYANGGTSGVGYYANGGTNGSGSYWNSGRSGSKAYNSGNENGSYSNSNNNSSGSGSNSNNNGYEQQYGTVITLYADGGFTGATKNISSDWSVSSIGDSWNDAISSIRVPPGWKVTIYRDAGFQGRSMVIVGNWSVSGQFDEWNDQISSVRVTKP
ncbi:peptidase inhibitor family I36 protein [Fibrella forsythiae]|uniref:Beta/gamma crystallin 'Greek key' domain-containing protein n=1 Tax=Fibrella forsythiae TaxID=2817061 RepID=A0ABS3JSX6_9BACT|nr:peptidase inhibitor family I36 protein [Fibrella forsythiae]MBO0953109.1 hypothetical protein [Fibrella forsythiae]